MVSRQGSERMDVHDFFFVSFYAFAYTLYLKMDRYPFVDMLTMGLSGMCVRVLSFIPFREDVGQGFVPYVMGWKDGIASAGS